MRSTLAILIVLLCGASLVACRSGFVTNPSSNATPSQGASATMTAEGTDMSSQSPLDATAQRMVTLASEHLATRLNARLEQIALVKVTPVRWRDAGLGCPKPNIDYMQRETPGYNVLLEAGGDTFEYHTDQGKRAILCKQR